MSKLLDEVGRLESSEGTVLLDGAKSASRNGQNHRLLEFRDINALLLEVRRTANLAAWVKLSRTSAV